MFLCMKRSPVINLAHTALQDVRKNVVMDLIDSVNLTPQEKEIIIKSELEGMRIAELQDQFNLSVDSIMRIKTKGMQKIGAFIMTITQQ